MAKDQENRRINARVIACCIIGVSGIMLFTFLLVQKIISQTNYSILFALLAIVLFALLGFDRISELGLGKFKLILRDMKDVRDETFAKIQEMKSLAENMAVIVSSLATDQLQLTYAGNYLLISAREKNRARLRDRVLTILNEVESDKGLQETIRSDFNKQIYRKMKTVMYHGILDKARTIVKERLDSQKKVFAGQRLASPKESADGLSSLKKEEDRLYAYVNFAVHAFENGGYRFEAIKNHFENEKLWTLEMEKDLIDLQNFFKETEVDLSIIGTKVDDPFRIKQFSQLSK